MKEEVDDDEAVKAAKVKAYFEKQRLLASSDDPDDTPGYNAVYMRSVNDHRAWEGDIEEVIAMSIREAGMPLVDLTGDDDGAGPSGAVKDEPADEDADLHGKKDVVDDARYNFHHYYDRSGRRKFY